MAKDKKWDGKSVLYVDIFYPIELKSVFCKWNESIEGVVRWLGYKEKGDGIDTI